MIKDTPIFSSYEEALRTSKKDLIPDDIEEDGQAAV
jgi:hypothetical protein